MRINRIEALVIISLLTACSSSPTPTSSPKLIGGQVATEGQFPSVVKFSACTAVKVGPKSFLTAAHCVGSRGEPGQPRILEAGTDIEIEYGLDSAHFATHSLRVAKVALHPDYLHFISSGPVPVPPPASSQPPDVALVSVEAETPSIGISAIDTTALGAGDKMILTGYGCEAAAANDPLNALAPRLKFHRTEVQTILNNYLIIRPTNADGVEGRGCFGDSGGPMFIEAAAAPHELRVAGILSFRARTAGIPSIALTGIARLDNDMEGHVGDWLTTALAAPVE